jgi:hypothetical protein
MIPYSHPGLGRNITKDLILAMGGNIGFGGYFEFCNHENFMYYTLYGYNACPYRILS